MELSAPPLCDPPRQAPCGLPTCQQALRDAHQQVGYYRAQHQRATRREAQLKQLLAQHRADAEARVSAREHGLRQRIEELEAEVRLLKQRLYGRSCEHHHAPNVLAHAAAAPDTAGGAAAPNGAGMPPPRRRRGQQRGRPGHGRRDYGHLPATPETADLPPSQRQCMTCGKPFAPCGSEPDLCTVVEVEVRAHRRVIRRRRYRPTCVCGTHPAIIPAPPPPRLIANGALGVSVWVAVLLDKYAFYCPTYRLLAQWRLVGLDLALGTLTDGLQQLLPLLEPVYEALRSHNQKQTHWHGDETRWQVFATTEGKGGHLWYLWLVLSAEAAVFTLAAGRAHDVPEEVLGPDARGIFNVDRYRAYPAMQQVKEGAITLALCWAHQRRDFIAVERGRPELHTWASAWLERIGQLYRLNEARLQVWQQDAAAFAQAHEQLKEAVAALAQAAQDEQAQADLASPCRKVLESLRTHWEGLTVFVEHPGVPMDNNAAERAERGPVVGRKNYYGSGAVWAGQLAAVMFSVLQTLGQWGLNARLWLTGYLTACAANGGHAVPDLRPWLPWSMTEAERAEWKLPAKAGARAAQDSS